MTNLLSTTDSPQRIQHYFPFLFVYFSPCRKIMENKDIAFRILSMFQPVFEVRVWKPPWTLCWAQLPIFTVFSCPFAISISSSLFKASQFTFGPSIASCKKLASFNPEVEYVIFWKRLSALGLPKNWEWKYQVSRMLVSLFWNRVLTIHLTFL